MNILETDKNILNIIKYGAVVPIIIFSFIITYILVEQKNIELKNELSLIKSNFLKEKKQLVKDEVLRVVSSLNNEIEKSEESLKKTIKEKVYEAHRVASNIYKEESSHKSSQGHAHSDEHILNTIKYALGGMIYNKGRGYIFLDDINGVKILQPLNKKFEGINLLEYEDANGYKLVKKIVQTIKDKSENFDTYYWYKSKEDNEAYKKMSFYKYFEPLNLAIGTGEYLVDFESELKEKLLKRIKNISFGKNGYIFIFDKKGTYLSHFKDEKIGTNGFKVKDAKGRYFIREFIDYANKNTQGYVSYTASAKPNGKIEHREKISFVYHFEKWNWTLGAGFYLKELEDNIAKKEEELITSYDKMINQITLISFAITIALLIFSFFVSRLIANKFEIYKKNIKKEIEKTVEKERLLVHQSKLATMGEMIANISHQWRQPLSVITTAATGVKFQKEMNCLNDKEFFEAMNLINNSSQYLSHTVEDFRDFFNPNKTKEKFFISETFTKAFNLVQHQYNKYEIDIEKELEDFELFEKENELLQVILNILKNAKDELIKKEHNRLILITSKVLEDKYQIEIQDNAGGIKDELLSKIFEAYFTTKKSSEGTGIGLSMSEQIIKKMNGSLEVENCSFSYENQNYKGAKFIISLPISSK